jgi:hypothetical protein
MTTDRVVSVNFIPDQIQHVQVISCSKVGKTSFEIFVDGIIDKTTVLKTRHDECIKVA